MLKKGALALLSAYNSDSSDEDNEVPGSGVTVKRLCETEEGEQQSHKISKLPLPKEFLNNKPLEEHIDDPTLHSGRVRTFAHERGNWVTFVYILYEENEAVNELAEALKKCGATLNIDIQKVDEFHISLTRTVILKYHWINLFVNTIKTNTVLFRKFMILFDTLKVYCNEERTRTFIGLQIKSGYDSLLNLVGTLDKCLEEFNLPRFYKDPSFHMSIVWCVGDFEEELKSLLPQLNRQLQELMDEYSQENWYIYVDCLMCKTGNKYFNFYLT